MDIMKDQQWASPQRGLPVHVMDASAAGSTISSETVAFYYSNAGVRTVDAGQLAGVVVEAKLAYNKIMNAAGSMLGTFSDKSLSFTSTAFTTEVSISSLGITLQQFEALDAASFALRLSTLTSGMSNGQYVVDYRTGTLYGKKDSTQTSLASASYKIQGNSGGTGLSALQVQGNVAAGTTDSGNPVKVGAIYTVANPTYTDGQRTELHTNSLGILKGAEQYASQADDQVFHVFKTQMQGKYTVPLTASALVATGAGQLMGFVVNSCAAGATLKIWDNTSAATTVMFDTMTFTLAEAQGPKVFMLPAAVKFTTGCYFTIAGAAMSVTPIWNQ